MAAMAMASFPFTNNFSGCCSPTLSPNSNGYIRADLSTDGATRACIIILTNDKEISLAINLLSNPNQLFGTGDRTEPASLASLSINFYLGHKPSQNGMPNIKVQMSNQIQSSNAVTQGFSLEQDQP
jgi:hypothetical protein